MNMWSASGKAQKDERGLGHMELLSSRSRSVVSPIKESCAVNAEVNGHGVSAIDVLDASQSFNSRQAFSRDWRIKLCRGGCAVQSQWLSPSRTSPESWLLSRIVKAHEPP